MDWDDNDSPTTLSLWFFISILIAMFIAVGIIVFSITRSVAHDATSHANLDPSERDWFGEQKIPEGHPNAGQSCCSQADGEFAEEDIRQGHYWVRWAKGGDKWHQVPDEAIIRKPSPHPRAAVWWGGTAEGTINTIYIRCFYPGALL